MTDPSEKPIRILLVDDEEDLVTFLSHRLLKRGYTVTAKTAGPAAVSACEQQTFDVAILDLKMPEMDGIEVLQYLKQHQPMLEAIMLTGHGSHESALEAGKLKAFRYLLKPYEFDELVALIEEAATAKRDAMRERFLEEHTRLVSEGSSAREIKEASDRLRREYEQD